MLFYGFLFLFFYFIYILSLFFLLSLRSTYPIHQGVGLFAVLKKERVWSSFINSVHFLIEWCLRSSFLLLLLLLLRYYNVSPFNVSYCFLLWSNGSICRDMTRRLLFFLLRFKVMIFSALTPLAFFLFSPFWVFFFFCSCSWEYLRYLFFWFPLSLLLLPQGWRMKPQEVNWRRADDVFFLLLFLFLPFLEIGG